MSILDVFFSPGLGVSALHRTAPALIPSATWRMVPHRNVSIAAARMCQVTYCDSFAQSAGRMLSCEVPSETGKAAEGVRRLLGRGGR